MKIYYNNSIVSEIEYQIRNSNYVQALNIAEKYEEDYPLDKLAPIYRGRAMVLNGMVDEGISLCEDTIYLGQFHEKSALVIAYTWYGNALVDAQRFEEAEKAYEYAIKNESPSAAKVSIKARINLINTYIRQRKYEKALHLINECKNSPFKFLPIKEAYIYMNMNQYEKALKVLDGIAGDTPHTKQQISFYKGKCHYNLGNYDEALKHFNDGLTEKNFIYYLCNHQIANIYYLKSNFEEAKRYAEVAFSYPDTREDANLVLFKINIKNGYMDEAKKQIDLIEDEYKKDYHLGYYYFAIGEYEKALVHNVKALNKCEDEAFNKIIRNYIYSYIRLGRYEEAKYILDNVYDDVNDSLRHILYTYLYKKLGLTYDKAGNFYSCLQIVSYDRDRAIDHILSHHVLDCYYSSFNSKEEAIKLYDYIQSELGKYTPIHESIFDKYLIPFQGVGYDEKGNLNTLVVVVNPDDLSIITMYPLAGNDVHLDDDETKIETKPKTKRLSQIDKFNKRYGK